MIIVLEIYKGAASDAMCLCFYICIQQIISCTCGIDGMALFWKFYQDTQQQLIRLAGILTTHTRLLQHQMTTPYAYGYVSIHKQKLYMLAKYKNNKNNKNKNRSRTKQTRLGRVSTRRERRLAMKRTVSRMGLKMGTWTWRMALQTVCSEID